MHLIVYSICSSKNVSTAVKQVPEINIFLSKEAIDCSEPG